jgi:hypothetical protein
MIHIEGFASTCVYTIRACIPCTTETTALTAKDIPIITPHGGDSSKPEIFVTTSEDSSKVPHCDILSTICSGREVSFEAAGGCGMSEMGMHVSIEAACSRNSLCRPAQSRLGGFGIMASFDGSETGRAKPCTTKQEMTSAMTCLSLGISTLRRWVESGT